MARDLIHRAMSIHLLCRYDSFELISKIKMFIRSNYNHSPVKFITKGNDDLKNKNSKLHRFSLVEKNSLNLACPRFKTSIKAA